ncbi:hypothetical protein PMAYCL1PPCAC_18230 [Pristionchus mayeri]|uniref:Fibronectin type-III domain-containing protein n=1 Tax=Pristionchus mayeri TaxID=1317129 RepID=A0AAN5CP59_9BILA|nr:hypothetical protein PMAYCL1PPCAC_18230 [Pristionchus mayeri]
MMAGWLDPPMEVIPEEGESEGIHSPLHSSRHISRRREIFTSEQLDTLLSTVPKDRLPQDWIIDNEVVEPKMASTYLTEGLGEGAARGSTYTYTYESHYDVPPEEGRGSELDEGLPTSHKVTRVTRVTTTRSVRQIPLESPYDEVFFDANGRPIPVARGEWIEGNGEGMGIRLSDLDRIAPPPAPPLARRGSGTQDSSGIPSSPGMPEIVESDDAQITLCWAKPTSGLILGYQMEMRDYPDGDWETVDDHMLREPSCTITNLDSSGEVQFRVSAAGRGGFSPPSPSSIPILLKSRSMPSGSSLPLSPGKPVVVGVDGSRASLEWTAPPANPHAPPLMGFQVEYRVYGTTDWMIANDSLTTETRYEVENLRPNGVYEFRVRGRNGEGLGSASRCSGPAHIKPAVPTRSARCRPLGEEDLPPPGQPFVLESDVNWVKLEWGEMKEDVEYLVELREVGDPSWYQANHEPVPSNSIHLEGLRPGSTYEFRVLSFKNGMFSLPSEVSDVVSLRPLWKGSSISRSVPSRPSAPELMEVEGDRVTLCWQPALSTLPVLGYDVEFRDYQQDSGWYKVNDTPMSACKMTVGDLIVGHEYEFRIIAMNSVGFSSPSLPSALLPIRGTEHSNGESKLIETERFGSIRLLQEEMVRESPPLPDRDDSPPPINRSNNNGTLQWRDPNLREVIEYLSSMDREKQKNASGYLQHLTYSDQSVKDETRELGGIPKLLLLLRSDHPIIVKNACACLKNLCYGKENDANKMEVLFHDGVRLLSAVVSTGASDERAKEATAVLWNLSSSDPLKRPILEHAAHPLASIVNGQGNEISSRLHEGGHSDPSKYYHTSLFKNATGVLRNISAADSSARRVLRSIGSLIDTLVNLLTLSIQRNFVDSTSVENAVCILRNLSYRIQEVEDGNYDPTRAHDSSRRSKSTPASPKPTKKEKKKEKKREEDTLSFHGISLLWDANTVRIYLKLLQEASNHVTLEACAGAIQNLAACQWNESAQVRTAVRVEKGLPVLVELIRLQEDHVTCAVATALRNLALDDRNRELIGKYALRDLLNKLPEAGARRPTNGPSDQTIAAVLGILFEIVRASSSTTKEIHEARGTDQLRSLAKSFPAYSERVCKYASQVLYMMWQHKELHDGFKRSGLKEADFYCGSTVKGGNNHNHTATLARPISSQGRERPRVMGGDPNETQSSEGGHNGYGTMGETTLRNGSNLKGYSYNESEYHNGFSPHPSDMQSASRYDEVPSEPLYASVNKTARAVDDSWV